MEEQRPGEQGLLSPYRILDLADAKGAYCTKALADLGADVIKVEPRDGDPTRRLPPFAKDTPGPDRSLYFLYHNTNKRGITLNLETEDGRHLVRQLVATADVLVETFAPGYMDSLGLGYSHLREINSRLIMASITPFGQSGPRRDHKMAPIVAFAMSGAMHGSGLPEKPPLDAPHPLAYQAAAVITGTGIMLALYARGANGQGQHIDVSVQEAAIDGLAPWGLPNLTPEGAPDANLAGRQTGLMTQRSTGFPIYACRDGYVRMWTFTPRQWEALVQILSEPEVLKSPEWQDREYRNQNQSVFVDLFSRFAEQRTVAEVFREGQALGLSVNPVYSPAGFLDDPHTQSRGFASEVDHPEVGRALYLGSPYRLGDAPLTIRRPAPRLGEHNEEVYCDEQNLAPEELAALRATGVV